MTDEITQSVATTAGEGVKAPVEDPTKTATPEGEGVQTPPEPTPEQQAADERKRKAEDTQKRIHSLTGRAKQAEAATLKLQLENAEMKGKLSVQPAAPAEAAPPKPGAHGDYENHDDWLAAHRAFDRHEMRQEFEARQTKQSSHAEEQARRQTEADGRQKLAAGFAERETEARAKYGDYDDVIDNSPAEWNDSMREVAMGLPNGPDVVYHISQNPDEATRIAGLDPTSAAVELGAVGARLAVASPKPKTTSAPDPVVPVGGGAETPGLDPDKMTHEQYRVHRGYEATLKR